MNRNILFFILSLCFVLFFIIVLIRVLFAPSTSTQSTEQEQVLSPTNVPLPTRAPLAPEAKTSQFLNTLETRPSLSEKDAIIRAGLIGELQGETGILHTSDSYIISYLKSPDVFQVEVLSRNIQGARSESLAWFSNKGLSMRGICTLPINYFLSYPILEEVKSSGASFSPLPDGC